MKIVTLSKKDKILKGEISLPASKSISNRALIINYLSDNKQQLTNLSKSDDTQLMIQLLDIISKNKSLDLPATLNCDNAGTVMRFLTALLAKTPGNYILNGSERMRERPIGILVEALNKLGAEINYLEKDGFPPIQIKGKPLKGGNVTIDSSVSSQFISALLLIAPTLKNGLQLTLPDKISSRPYIYMTLEMLKHFGINYTFEGNEIYIRQQNYTSSELFIEPDWSAAAYWYEMVALSDKADILLKDLNSTILSTLTLKSGLTDGLSKKLLKNEFMKHDSNPTLKLGLKEVSLNKKPKNQASDNFLTPALKLELAKVNQSLQGDAILPRIYESFGIKTEILDQGIRLTKKCKSVTEFEFDFINYPDLAQSVIVTCAALGINGKFTGLESLRIKETDRLEALQTELQKLGFKTEMVRSSEFHVRSWEPGEIKNLKSKIVNTYGDHRMAMAFSPLALIFKNIQIEKPEVVSKSYPGFWKDLNDVGIEASFCK